MPEPSEGDPTVRGREVTEMGWAWWVALVVVPAALGVLGRDESGGFRSVFLWAVVAFALGSLAAFGLAAAIGGREPVRRLAAADPSGRRQRGTGDEP